MYKQILESISGVEIWPIISILIFMVIFAVVVFRAVRMDRKLIERMASLPLEKQPSSNGEAR